MKRKGKHSLYAVFSLILMLQLISAVNGRIALDGFNCLDDSDKTRIANDFYPINILVSDRPTHQIISRIYIIFLREVLGFHNITLVPLPRVDSKEDGGVYTVSNLFDLYGDQIATIDVAVWKDPTRHIILPPGTNDAGLSMRYGFGRFGFFVPSDLMNVTMNSTDYQYSMTHSVLMDPSSSNFQMYVIDDALLETIRKMANITSDDIYTHCDNSQPGKCATILSEFRKDTNFVERHIDQFNLQVQIYWLGGNLPKIIEWLLQTYSKENIYKRFIILHWQPSHVINGRIDYEAMAMPRCEDIDPLFCKYELTPIVKFYSDFLKNTNKQDHFSEIQNLIGPMLEKSLKKMQIEKVESFLKYYNNTRDEASYNDVACKWMRNNSGTYTKWNSTRQSTLVIGVIAPLTMGAWPTVLHAIKMAADEINANATVLPDHDIEIKQLDGECQSDAVMSRFLQFSMMKTNFLLGIIGPACSDTVEPIAGVSKYVHVSLISYSAEGGSFENRDKYPYFFRTIGSNSQYIDVYVQLFKEFGWRRAATLTEDGQIYTEYIARLEERFRQNEITLIVNKKYSKDVTSELMRKHLQELKDKRVKIIIADIFKRNHLEIVMCEAFEMGMIAEQGYVWFLPAWYSSEMFDDMFYDGSTKCTHENFMKAIDGHLSLRHSPFASNSSKIPDNRNVSEWLDDYQNWKNSQSQKIVRNANESIVSVDQYAGYAYDAVWVYALAAHSLVEKNLSITNIHLDKSETPKKFTELIQATNFDGVSGQIRFDAGGSRIANIEIMHRDKGRLQVVGCYKPHVNETSMRVIEGVLEWGPTPIWDSEEIPTDGTYDCALSKFAELLHIECEHSALVLVLIICCLTIVLISVLSFTFWKRRYDRKLHKSAKKLKGFGIDLLRPSGQSDDKSLDKWEIPKDRVVINRRLGEGAFGTVFGGEAKLIDSDGWTAVAIKTLKRGAATADRLDFLSEAVVMKQFDHKNIVQILGVCLQSEPIYTVMEFMLYGDLKTFLLARRHMIHSKDADESSDVSAKRLTLYALDVARGLSYLAVNKYVHRDVACRNCLVNAKRVVKLADFGMTRPMFESDYYRFNRKGMLPVRWMAPESLGLGLFTPASDIWSFGVLLYEIITFGSFPYQGMSNSEVLDYVKAENTLKIPKGTKPHLEGLIKACWHKEHKKRPSAMEIVEYIAGYPRLLTPCLDIPISSIVPESSSDQMEILPRNNNNRKSFDILNHTSSINNFDCGDKSQVAMQRKNDSLPMEGLNVLPTVGGGDGEDGYSVMAPLIDKDGKKSLSNSSSQLYADKRESFEFAVEKC